VSDPNAERFAPWKERARAVQAKVESSRADHASLDLGLSVVERDSAIGGGLLAGALAYRLFVLLLPSALLFVSGLGLYADTADKSAGQVAKDAGLHGLKVSAPGGGYGFGLGIRNGRPGDAPTIWHSGGAPGAAGELDIDPRLGIVAVTLGNVGPPQVIPVVHAGVGRPRSAVIRGAGVGRPAPRSSRF
jgi:hypothetical protein